MQIFNGFHWPTFFLALAVFILLANLWNILKFTLIKNRAAARVKESDAALKNLLSKLKAKDQEINDLIAKFKQPKS
ncbi:MAG: hypothetical protein JW873_01245 [Candidatus Saganbacteria bacterium]|nr:hypothetical protein [Candidatus Saganbacteria bacterium]